MDFIKLSNHQFSEISKQALLEDFPQFVKHFNQLIENDIIIYNDEKSPEALLKLHMEEAFKLEILTKEGMVKYMFVQLVFDNNESNNAILKNLDNRIKNTLNQKEKVAVLDEFVLEGLEFNEYWRN
jgi:hypothetical protein